MRLSDHLRALADAIDSGEFPVSALDAYLPRYRDPPPIGLRPRFGCEHVWHADGDYDRCDLCHGQKKREPL